MREKVRLPEAGVPLRAVVVGFSRFRVVRQDEQAELDTGIAPLGPFDETAAEVGLRGKVIVKLPR
jgi:hypothetical protein